MCNKFRMVRDEAAAAHPADLQEVRQQVERMVADGQASEAVAVLLTLVQSMQKEIAGLSLRVASLLKQLYGRRSEKVDPNQLRLFMEALSDDQAQAALADGLPSKAATKPVEKPKPKPAPHGRKPLPADLPREEVVLEPAPADKHCEACGIDKVLIGYEVSELLDWVPGHFLVRVLRRAKLSCPSCEDGVVVAPVADKVIEKGRPGPGLLAHVMVAKYQDHLPLNRLEGIFARHGVELATSTLSGWVAAGAEALEPLYRELVRRVTQAYVLGTDDTGLRVLDPSHENGVRRGVMWAYVAPEERLVVFDYTPDHKADGPASFLVEKRSGVVQSDGYAGYKRIAREHANAVAWAGCMAHARRKFVEALDAGDKRAAGPVAVIQGLYKIEAEATEAGDTPDQRLERRRRLAGVSMASLGRWLWQMKPSVAPKSPLGRAITYAVNQWPSLQVYLTDGRIPIDNNGVERQIRRVAVGRKNYLFAGSDEGARRAAILYSILGTCSLTGADPYAYLRDVLEHLSHGWPASRIAELLPDAWAAAVCVREAAGPPDAAAQPASP